MDLIVNAWFEYWIDLKKETVRPNTVRNYSERYERNTKSDIGKPTKKKEASKSGYRKVLLTDEAISILKRQKEKHKDIKVIPMEWVDFVFLCRKGSPIKNSTYDTALFKICDKADIPRFFYACTSTYVCNEMYRGWNEAENLADDIRTF